MQGDNQILDSLAERGLKSIFNGYSRWYGFGKDVGEEEVLSLLQNEALFEFFDSLKADYPLIGVASLLKPLAEEGLIPDYWRERFVALSDLGNIRDSISSIIKDDAPHIDFGISLNEDFNYYAYFSMLHEKVSSFSWVPESYSRCLEGLCEQSPMSFKIFADSNLFDGKVKSGINSNIRGHLYRKYIESGFLNEKTARKIRSESSEYASEAGVAALIESEDLYPDYNDLLLKFTDSRHEAVLHALARSLPVWMLSSLMGCNSESVKSIIEHRMNTEV
jgi:hypothetical protein